MLMKLRENVKCLKGNLCTLQRLVQKAPHQHVTSFVRVLSLKEEDLQSERSHYAVILLQLSQSQNLVTFFFVQLWRTMTAGKFRSNQAVSMSSYRRLSHK